MINILINFTAIDPNKFGFNIIISFHRTSTLSQVITNFDMHTLVDRYYLLGLIIMIFWNIWHLLTSSKLHTLFYLSVFETLA